MTDRDDLEMSRRFLEIVEKDKEAYKERSDQAEKRLAEAVNHLRYSLAWHSLEDFRDPGLTDAKDFLFKMASEARKGA